MCARPAADGRGHARTLPGQRIVNRVMCGVLRVPVLHRVVSRQILLIEVVGRRTGRRYAVPVAYVRDSEGGGRPAGAGGEAAGRRGHRDLLVGTEFPWGRNLRTGEPVTIVLGGVRRVADVTVLTAEQDVVEAYAAICRSSRQFPSFNRIAMDAHGEPDPGDLAAAWRSGARAFRLTPREDSDLGGP